MMDNFGYKEVGAASKPSRRVRINRTVSVYSGTDGSVPPEELPLNGIKYKRSNSTSFRWRSELGSFREKKTLDSFDYIVGPPSPTDSLPSVSHSYEESSIELNNQINSENFKNTLYAQAIQASIQKTILDDIALNTVTNGATIFKKLSKLEKNLCFLWSSLHKCKELLEDLLELGADLHFCDILGMTAIHYSSFSGCLACSEFLISKGADVNGIIKSFSPLHCAVIGNNPDVVMLLLNNDADITMTTIITNCEENVLHCAVRANAVECLDLLINMEEINVNSIEPSGANPIHLAAMLGKTRSLQLLLESQYADIHAITRIRDKKSSALHLAASAGNIECVNLLLKKGANVKLKNHRGFTALHLAVRSSSLVCVESLLKNGKADPNAEDFDKRTPLHVAIVKSDLAFQIIEMLIKWGADVNKKDEYGFTPLHSASLDGLSQCVETLIYHGADVTTKSKKGSSALNVITRKTPASIGMITQKLDDAINLQNNDKSSDREVELQFDFSYILQHCHLREINYLNVLVDEGQKEILLHPLCSAFLHVKWEKIRKYYLARLMFYFLFVLFLSLYVLTALAYNCYSSSKGRDGETDQELCQTQSLLGKLLRKNPFMIGMQWWLLASITIFEIFRKIYGMAGYSGVKQYVTQLENLMDWFVIISVFLISYGYTNSSYPWRNHVGAFAVLASWTNLMLMVGQFPAFGSYVAMYQKVQKEFAKLFMAYVCILIGFTISFCVIFPDSSMFANPFVGFITVITMMIGEQDLNLLLNDPNGLDPPILLEISAQITYVLFLMFVTIVLMNLLVGIAVPDIEDLRKTAGLSKLVRQTKLISYMETGLFNIFLPKFFKDILRQSALVSPQPQHFTLNVKPLNPGEERLPKDIMMTAYDIALTKKSNKTSILTKSTSNHNIENDDVEMTKYKNAIPILESKVNQELAMMDTMKNEVRELKLMVCAQQEMLQKFLLSKSNGVSINNNQMKK